MRSNPGHKLANAFGVSPKLKLANAFGVNGHSLWLWLCDSVTLC
jgi:hypothetical protein